MQQPAEYILKLDDTAVKSCSLMKLYFDLVCFTLKYSNLIKQFFWRNEKKSFNESDFDFIKKEKKNH